MAGLVLAVLLPSLRSLAVTVKLPLVPKGRLKSLVPATRAASAGRMAARALEEMSTMSPTELTRFQLASTALTVTLTGLPVVCAEGVPVLPVVVPGAAGSPGTNNCTLAKAPGLTVTLPLVPEVRPVALAVMVRVPAVLKVKLDRLPVPEARVMLPAVPPLSSDMAALPSVVVRVTLGTALPARFQFASTALTITPFRMAAPAVCG